MEDPIGNYQEWRNVQSVVFVRLWKWEKLFNQKQQISKLTSTQMLTVQHKILFIYWIVKSVHSSTLERPKECSRRGFQNIKLMSTLTTNQSQQEFILTKRAIVKNNSNHEKLKQSCTWNNNWQIVQKHLLLFTPSRKWSPKWLLLRVLLKMMKHCQNFLVT